MFTGRGTQPQAMTQSAIDDFKWLTQGDASWQGRGEVVDRSQGRMDNWSQQEIRE
jgi:hypothetical protein